VSHALDARLHLEWLCVTTQQPGPDRRPRAASWTRTDGESLVNRRLAYVAISRGRYDAQIFTNDKTQLGPALAETSHRRRSSWRGQAQAPDMAAQPLQPAETPRQSIGKGISQAQDDIQSRPDAHGHCLLKRSGNLEHALIQPFRRGC
jgi:hypothetical protein